MIQKSFLIALAFMVSLGFARDAQAQAKLELGLRTGVGFPFGKATDAADDELSKLIAGQVPLWLDFGARIAQRFYVGGYLAYGFGIPGETLLDECDAATGNVEMSCSAHDWRFGAQFHVHLGEPRQPHPWFGAGIGYEFVGWTITAEQGNQEASASVGAAGWEFFNLQAGVELPITEVVALSPFAAFTVAQYADLTLECTGPCGIPSQEHAIEDRALHHWMLLGLRATFLLEPKPPSSAATAQRE